MHGLLAVRALYLRHCSSVIGVCGLRSLLHGTCAGHCSVFWPGVACNVVAVLAHPVLHLAGVFIAFALGVNHNISVLCCSGSSLETTHVAEASNHDGVSRALKVASRDSLSLARRKPCVT
jgi:hypothetical protein